MGAGCATAGMRSAVLRCRFLLFFRKRKLDELFRKSKARLLSMALRLGWMGELAGWARMDLSHRCGVESKLRHLHAALKISKMCNEAGAL